MLVFVNVAVFEQFCEGYLPLAYDGIVGDLRILANVLKGPPVCLCGELSGVADVSSPFVASCVAHSASVASLTLPVFTEFIWGAHLAIRLFLPVCALLLFTLYFGSRITL